jgi:hypothetical protein
VISVGATPAPVTETTVSKKTTFPLTLRTTQHIHAKPATIRRLDSRAMGAYRSTLQQFAQEVEGDFLVTIDIDALCQFVARRAMFTKSGKSELQDGLVTAERVRRRNIGEPVLQFDRTAEYPADQYEVTLLDAKGNPLPKVSA